MPVSRGFRGLRRDESAGRRLPPGQYLERGFPVLTAGPAPRIAPGQWTFTVGAPGSPARIWTFNEFIGLGAETVTCDIHCVTRWSKFDTTWQGVSVDTLLALAYGQEPPDAGFVVAYAEGGFTTNLPLADVVGAGPGWSTPLRAGPWLPNMAAPRACWCRTCTCGRAPSGYGACGCWRRTTGASGRVSATTTGAIPGWSSAIRMTDR